jgi:phenylpropionate dioxygenase-like ring-hydroxylating dioxygenase large terminal subunit
MNPHWSEQWWPVAYLNDLDRRVPSRFTLLERDLVLWWDRAGDCWRAFPDVCPHRLVPLSEGRINGEGLLECPYHGWSFSGDGECRHIPQAGPGTQPGSRRSRCSSLPTASGQGLLFVWTGDPDGADPALLPLVPMLRQQGNGWADGWIVQDTFRDLPMDALTLLENVLDVSHVPFTHHRTVGRRENAAPVEAVISRQDGQGFEALWQEGPRRGRLGSQSTTFRAPQLMWHDLTARGFGRILTVVYAVPIRRGECRLFARFPFQFQSALPRWLVGLRPRWLQHIGNHKVLEDDQVFLHWQERLLERAGGSAAAERAFFLPTAADRYVAALHHWVQATGGEPFAGSPLPPRQQLEGLMDRYHSHTRHCRSCSTALARIEALRPWLWGGLWLAAVLIGLGQLGWLSWLGLALAAAAGLALQRCETWRRGLRSGDGQAPRNRLG